jgi:alanine racemase
MNFYSHIANNSRMQPGYGELRQKIYRRETDAHRVVCAGYADGYFELTNKAQVTVNGHG